MFSDTIGTVVMQPTSLCNADCDYCYLPHRNENNLMSLNVANQVAEFIREQGLSIPVTIVWHGGEPLAAGRKHFTKLLSPFKDLVESGRAKHYVQTNATLITQSWCDFFLKNGFEIGVSIDGPEWANTLRVDWAGSQLYPRIIKGIDLLKRNNIPIHAIAVVSEANLERASELYDFFCGLGCEWIGFNIEEVEGANQNREPIPESKVRRFWFDLYGAWRNNPRLIIREFDKALSYIGLVLNGKGAEWRANRLIDPFPTISYDGEVFLLSPELAASTTAGLYGSFSVGNIVSEPLSLIVERGIRSSYVADYVAGVNLCKSTCPYFNYCGGGQASNKWFERGTINVAETAFCRNSYQRVLDTVINSS